jgi:hypothetical protein
LYGSPPEEGVSSELVSEAKFPASSELTGIFPVFGRKWDHLRPNTGKSSNAHVTRNQTMRIFLIRMNNKKPPFDNINARKCFAHVQLQGFIESGICEEARRRPRVGGREVLWPSAWI